MGDGSRTQQSNATPQPFALDGAADYEPNAVRFVASHDTTTFADMTRTNTCGLPRLQSEPTVSVEPTHGDLGPVFTLAEQKKKSDKEEDKKVRSQLYSTSVHSWLTYRLPDQHNQGPAATVWYHNHYRRERSVCASSALGDG